MDENIRESTDNGRFDSVLMLDDVILCGWPLFSKINEGSNVVVKTPFSISICTYKPEFCSFTASKVPLLILQVIFLQFF